MSKNNASVNSHLRKSMEFAGFTYDERASGAASITFWRQVFTMPSLREGAKPLALVTAIPSRSFSNTFTFQTQLFLDELPLHAKYQVPVYQGAPEEFILNQVPTFGTLFECEDFYSRKNDHPGVLPDEGNSQEVLLKLLVPEEVTNE
jgi:hypothetical protein